MAELAVDDPFDIPIAARPLHFFWVVDTSGSMAYEGKIQSLNTAVRESLPEMKRIARENPNARVRVRVLEFGSEVRWVVEEPVDVERFQWKDLSPTSTTPMGAALSALAEQLKMPPMEERALPPVIVLVSDGQPTDDFGAGLRRLLDEPWGQRAVRVAISIGHDADKEALRAFTGDEHPVLEANNPEQLTEYIHWLSTVAVKSVGNGAAAVSRLAPADDVLLGASVGLDDANDPW
jgi:uncharacterized protein YegL